MKVYNNEKCSIVVDKKQTTKQVLETFLSEIPFKIIIFDKDIKDLQNISSFDRVTNVHELQRYFGAKTYCQFAIEYDSDNKTIIMHKNRENIKDGVIALSKHFIREKDPKLKLACSAYIKDEAYNMCRAFVQTSLDALIRGEYYDVNITYNNETQNFPIVFVNDTNMLKRYLKTKVKFVDDDVYDLIDEIN